MDKDEKNYQLPPKTAPLFLNPAVRQTILVQIPYPVSTIFLQKHAMFFHNWPGTGSRHGPVKRKSFFY